jgi:arginase
LATDWEREQADRLGLHVGLSGSLTNDPAGAAASALRVLPAGPLAVHVDVDVLDFTDAPLAENTDGRNSGPSLEQLRKALSLAGQDPRLRALSIGELNPARSAGDPEVLLRFVDVLAATLGAKDARA